MCLRCAGLAAATATAATCWSAYPPGLGVVEVVRDDHDALTVTVESAPVVMGCRGCDVVAHAHGRVAVALIDAPAFGRPLRIMGRKRHWVCPDPGVCGGSFVEQDDRVATPKSKLTARAARWAIEDSSRARV